MRMPHADFGTNRFVSSDKGMSRQQLIASKGLWTQPFHHTTQGIKRPQRYWPSGVLTPIQLSRTC